MRRFLAGPGGGADGRAGHGRMRGRRELLGLFAALAPGPAACRRSAAALAFPQVERGRTQIALALGPADSLAAGRPGRAARGCCSTCRTCPGAARRGWPGAGVVTSARPGG